MRVEENRFLLSLADSDVELWARGVAHNSDYDVTIKEIDIGPVQVQGPKSKDVMVDLFGDSILEIPYYYLRPFELDGMKVLVSRTGYTGELGYEIYLYEASRNGVKLWDAVLEAGKPHDLAVIGPCHIRRIEGGILALGADMWYDTNPYEVGMGYDWMVDLEQGSDFIGKQALARIKQEGAKRKLVGVEIGGEPLGAYNDGSMIDFFPVNKDGERIGEVTSACFSPRLEKNIGYAMVPTEHADLGTELEVEGPEREDVRRWSSRSRSSTRRRRPRSRSSQARQAARTDPPRRALQLDLPGRPLGVGLDPVAPSVELQRGRRRVHAAEVKLERLERHAVEFHLVRLSFGRAQERHPLAAGRAGRAPNVEATAPLPDELDRAVRSHDAHDPNCTPAGLRSA